MPKKPHIYEYDSHNVQKNCIYLRKYERFLNKITKIMIID